MSYEHWDEAQRAPFLRSPWLPLALSALACALAVFAFFRQEAAIDAGRTAEVKALRVEHQLAQMQNESSAISGRINKLRKQGGSIAPLAARTLRSVFTIEAGNYLGTAFVAWVNDSGTYLITANHVIRDGGTREVTVTRKGGSWVGEVIKTDPKNDLALVRVDGHPQNAAPLWQRPWKGHPRTGEQLLLIGSPYGLGGTVTTGIVSRVTRKWVQTDAAANPGNSGGPAINRQGRVVGVLLAGGGENLNFAVRIERACARLRHCR